MAVRLTGSRACKTRPTTALVGLPTAPGALALPVADVEQQPATPRPRRPSRPVGPTRPISRSSRHGAPTGARARCRPAAATVAAFLAWEANRQTRPSTIGRRAAAIRYVHKLAGHNIPTDDERVRPPCAAFGARSGRPRSKKTPATSDRIMAMTPVAGARPR